MNLECKNCKYWAENPNDAHEGECRFNPPTLLKENTREEGVFPQTLSIFPTTYYKTWCGKFELLDYLKEQE